MGKSGVHLKYLNILIFCLIFNLVVVRPDKIDLDPIESIHILDFDLKRRPKVNLKPKNDSKQNQNNCEIDLI